MLLTSYIDYGPLIVLAAVIVVIILAFHTLQGFKRWKRDDTERAKRSFQAILVVLMVAIASTLALSFLTVLRPDEWEYTYEVNILTIREGQGTIHLPVSISERLQDAIRVTSGEGTASIVETERGLALRLVFQGAVTVRGSIISSQFLDEWGPTLLDPDVENLAWVELDYFNWTVLMKLDLKRYHLRTPFIATYEMAEMIEGGWNSYFIDYSQI